MEKEQFEDICSRLNIDETSKNSAIKQFTEISRNTILEVSLACSTLLIPQYIYLEPGKLIIFINLENFSPQFNN